MSRYYFVREVCERLGFSEQTVLNFIHNGELKAVNVARTPTGKKPRWRITEQALAEFEALEEWWFDAAVAKKLRIELDSS